VAPSSRPSLRSRRPPWMWVDTIGAGDSFQAALLFALRATGRIEPGSLARTNSDELRRALSFASICAAFTCGRAGADPPRHSEVGVELARLFPDRLKVKRDAVGIASDAPVMVVAISLRQRRAITLCGRAR